MNVLQSFYLDGDGPQVPLVQAADGNFYGTTSTGGSGNLGTVFKMTPSGTVTILHSFQDGSVTNDGSNPGGLVQGTDGNFYGTTGNGGSASHGTVFKITPSGTLAILHSFGDGSVTNDGYSASGLVQGGDGNFYGTTTTGGSAEAGTVFKMTTSGAVTILHSFRDGSVTKDGEYPYALTLGTDGNFYGTTLEGGSAGYGTAFKITSSGTVTILHSFGSLTNDGYYPYAGLVQGTNGNLYGTTENGGAFGCGTAFSITLSGTITILHSFHDGTVINDGYYPYAGLVQGVDGNFYGTTTEGGSAGEGTVFKMTPSGTVTIVHSFSGSADDDGANPEAALMQASDGSFYGTTVQGGTVNDGCAFKVTTSGTMTILHSYGTLPNDPQAGLVEGTDGNYYGTVEYGGSAGQGAIFGITPSGTMTILHSFADGSVNNDGRLPTSGLIQGSDGDLYGTTSTGGSAGDGTAFKVTLSGTVTILHSFEDGTVANDGSFPSSLIQASDGNFYGTTSSGGSAGYGAIFKITSLGTLTILHSFHDGSDGLSPVSVIQGSDGDLYGTAYNGGSAGFGTVFRATVSGTVTILHSFQDGSVVGDGEFPQAGLVEDTDGSFYGTTSSGGYSSDGTVFKITPSGTVTILYSFEHPVAGNGEYANQSALVLAADGDFYATTSEGGSANDGTIYQITPSGTLTVLHSFGDGSVVGDGKFPYASLVLGTDGNFYGTTSAGGLYGGGAVFEMTAPVAPTDLSATPLNSGIVLSWSASQSATSYDIYRGTSSGGESGTPVGIGITGTTYSDTGLTNGMTYYYTVAGVDALGTSATSNEASATPEIPQVPSAPIGLTAISGSTQIQLSWTADSGATTYNVYRGTTTGGEGATPIATGIASTSYTDTGLNSATAYYYMVAAVNGGGTSAQSTELAATTLTVAPVDLSADAGDTQVTLDWPAIFGATAYSVFRGTTSGGENATPIATINAQAPAEGLAPNLLEVVSYTDTGLTDGTRYYYQVAAVDAGGTSGPSNEANATPEPPIPSVPTGLTAAAGNTQITLSWTPSDGATAYNVYRGTTAGGEGPAPIATVAEQNPDGMTAPNTFALVDTYIDTGLTNGTTYYYMVAAVNVGGASGQSNEASATPELPATVTAVSSSTNPSTFGQNVTFTATVTGQSPTGTVQFTIDGSDVGSTVTLDNGVATYLTSSLSVGTHTVGAVYSGDSNNQASSGTLNPSQTVDPGSTTTAVSSSANPSTFGQNVTFTATVTGQSPTGTVQFTIDGSNVGSTVTLDNGVATYQTSSLSVGTHTVSAVYSGDADNAASQSTGVTQRVIPDSPTGLVAMPGNAQVALSWTAATGATSYDVYRSAVSGGETTPVVAGVTGTSWTNTGLTGGKTYYFKVKAVNGGGASGYSNEASATPIAAPTAPTGLTAKAGNALVTLTWTASSGATSYDVFRSAVSGGETTPVVTGVTTTSWTNTGLTNGKTYYFTVKAVNTGGTSGASNQASATPASPVPPAPTNLKATAGNAEVTLSWTASTSAASYEVFRAGVSGGETTPVVTGITATRWTNTGLTNGKTYYFTVKAVNAAGTSGASNQASATPE